jgi:catechol-2,3-dioxygenase
MGGFAFVKIAVRDLDGQTAFYQSVLGLRPVRHLPGQVVLSAAGMRAMANTIDLDRL